MLLLGFLLLTPLSLTLSQELPGIDDIADLDLSNVGLTGVKPQMFEIFTVLKSLNLSRNLIKFLPKVQLKNLENLDLSRNPLRFRQFYNGFTGLKNLDLSYIETSDFGDSYFFGLTNSTAIKLGGNRVKSFSAAMFENPSNVTWRHSEKVFKKGIKITDIKLCMTNSHVILLKNINDNEKLEHDCRKIRYDGNEELKINNRYIATFESEWYQVDNTRITTLNFDYNDIDELSTELLSNLPPEITKLSFHANKIEGVDSLKDINLLNGSLDLSYNSLKSTKTLALLPSSIITLSLAGNKFTEISTSDFSTLRNLYELDLSFNGLDDTGSGLLKNLGESYNIESPVNVTIFLLSYIPTLRILNLSGNQLEDIRILDLLPSRINILKLAKNKMTKALSTADFTHFSNLRELDISRNYIREVSSESMHSLSSSLRKLDLSSNQLTSIESDFFDKLTSLEYLNLSWNKLTNIGKSVFCGLLNIREINLSSNRLRTVENGTFEISTLKLLNLDSNSIDKTNLSPSMNTLKLLNSLSLVYNSLTSIEQIIIQHNNEIESNNESLCSRYVNYPNLISLNVTFNDISELKKTSFECFPSLKMLVLSNNKLSILMARSFELLESLEILDLSKNKISELDNQTFLGLSKILKIDLSFNKLKSITSDLFIQLNTLETLDLGWNALGKLAVGNFVKVPKKNLLLTGNIISEIQKGSFDLPDLETLNLDDNHLSKIGDSFQGLKKLKSLSLEYNFIYHIKTGDFRNISNHLNYLGLENNPIEILQNGALYGLSKTADTNITISPYNHMIPLTIMGGVFDYTEDVKT